LYFHKAHDDHTPQLAAFAEGTRQGHLTYIRCQTWAHGRAFLYGSFASNEALAAHLEQNHVTGSPKTITDSFYEILRHYSPEELAEGAPRILARLHFDLESYNPNHHSGPLPPAEAAAADSKLIDTLVVIAQKVREVMGRDVAPRFAVMYNPRQTKSDGYKFSYHVTVTNVYAVNNLDKTIAQEVVEEIQGTPLWDNGTGNSWVDLSVYTKNRNMRIAGPKDKGGPVLIPWYPSPSLSLPDGVRLAFTDPARNPPLAEILREMLICWPADAVKADPAAVILPPPALPTWVTKTDSLLQHHGPKATIVIEGKGASKKASNPYKTPSPARFVLKTPEDMTELGTKLLRFITDSGFSQSHGWDRPGTLEYRTTDATEASFYYTFAAESPHKCARDILHSGSSNRRRDIKVQTDSLDIYTRCFQGSKGDLPCRAWTRIGNCDTFTSSTAKCHFSSRAPRSTAPNVPINPSCTAHAEERKAVETGREAEEELSDSCDAPSPATKKAAPSFYDDEDSNEFDVLAWLS
jgi:hypothetical protein